MRELYELAAPSAGELKKRSNDSKRQSRALKRVNVTRPGDFL